MGPRSEISVILILGAAVLVVAIFLGQSMGNRVLGAIASRPASLFATPIAAPSASPGDDSESANAPLWKRKEVISVATDPAFPDPRVTPEPSPPPTPRPTPKPTPTNTDDAEPAPASGDQDTAPPSYTSPPLPLPLASHGADDTAAPDEGPVPSGSPGRSVSAGPPRPSNTTRPTLPPYTMSTPLP